MKRIGRSVLLATFASVTLLPASSAVADSLDPAVPELGHDARLSLDAAPADSSQVPVGLGVMVWPTEDPREYRVRPLRVGKVGIAIPAAGDTLWWEVPRQIDKADPSLLRPLQHAEDVRASWWRQILAGVLLLAAATALLRRVVRRREVTRELPMLVREAPHAVALRRLEQLRDSSWLDEGRFGEWYVEGSHALREYVGGRYRVAALDWTSGELLERLVEAGYTREELDAVEPLLRQADEVKFAQSRPTEHQAQSWLTEAVGFVQRTAVEVVFSTPEALAAGQRLNEGRLR